MAGQGSTHLPSPRADFLCPAPRQAQLHLLVVPLPLPFCASASTVQRLVHASMMPRCVENFLTFLHPTDSNFQSCFHVEHLLISLYPIFLFLSHIHTLHFRQYVPQETFPGPPKLDCEASSFLYSHVIECFEHTVVYLDALGSATLPILKLKEGDRGHVFLMALHPASNSMPRTHMLSAFPLGNHSPPPPRAGCVARTSQPCLLVSLQIQDHC